MLELYGIESLFIDGGMSYEKRDQVVFDFHQPGKPRVLIFSSVGSAGLNLAIADVVICSVSWHAYSSPSVASRILHHRTSRGVTRTYDKFVDVPTANHNSGP